MKQSIYTAIVIIMVTAAIGVFLSFNGYPPDKEGLSESSTRLREIATHPLFWAGFGAALTVPIMWFKRARLAETEGKARRIPALTVQLPALLALLVQIIIPLDLYNVTTENGSQIAFFYFILAFFLVMGNYIATVPFGSRVGFRTAATLADQTIWAKVHRALGRNLVVLALMSLPLPWLIGGKPAQWLVLGMVVCLKGALWLYARQLSARKRVRNAASQ